MLFFSWIDPFMSQRNSKSNFSGTVDMSVLDDQSTLDGDLIEHSDLENDFSLTEDLVPEIEGSVNIRTLRKKVSSCMTASKKSSSITNIDELMSLAREMKDDIKR